MHIKKGNMATQRCSINEGKNKSQPVNTWYAYPKYMDPGVENESQAG